MKKLFTILPIVFILCLLTQTAKAQEINMIDDVTYFETTVGEDGTMELVVSMDGMHKTVEFESNRRGSQFPKYLGKYKEALVFMHEAGRGYRNILVFRSLDGTLWESGYENQLCVIPENAESCLFFYDNTPVKVDYNRNGNPHTKFSKMGSKYAALKGHTIVSCNGDFRMEDDN